MIKVRWSQRCAGGCGRWLLVGAHAVRRHRALWCPDCHHRHLGGCVRCQEQEDAAEAVRVHRRAAADTMLW